MTHGDEIHRSGAHGGDVHSSGAHSGDIHGSGARNGEVHGSKARNGEVGGGQVGGGQVRGGQVRGGAVAGQRQIPVVTPCPRARRPVTPGQDGPWHPGRDFDHCFDHGMPQHGTNARTVRGQPPGHELQRVPPLAILLHNDIHITQNSPFPRTIPPTKEHP